MTVPAPKPTPGEIMESVLIQGDLDKLTPQQRSDYYMRVCESLRLNPLTRPFEYIRLNGRLQLYAKKDCTDQLRKINGISVKLVSRDIEDGVLTVHAAAKDTEGREDEDLGSVPFSSTLVGEARSNTIMKAVTKAKRRVTLSICGLGFLDETEVDDIPEVRRMPPRARPNVMLDADPYQPPPGEMSAADAAPADGLAPPEAGAAPESMRDELKMFERALAKAAEGGMAKLKEAWGAVPARYQHGLHAALERVYKPQAQAVDEGLS